MKLQQLRYISEIAQCNLNVSEAADILNTSQPGVSKQIRLLEQELGLPIFTRTGKRLAEITDAGKVIIEVADRILREVENLKKISSEYTNEATGILSIATTHTQARYALPDVIKAFRERYPRVILHIHQGNPTQIIDMVVKGTADFAIATEAIAESKELISLPCYEWNRCIVVPPNHKLLNKKTPLALKDVLEFPLVTYDFAFAGRSVVNEAFEKQNLTPNVVLTALDSDVIKTYVELGLGIGLLAKIAFDPKRDTQLRAIDVGHLFKPSITKLGLRKGVYLRGYMYEFIELFSPHLNLDVVAGAMKLENSF